MKDQDAIYNRIIQLGADIRLEIILAELLADSLSLKDVIVSNNSLFSRTFHRDIEKTEQVELHASKKKKFCFVVNREGLYDRLPEDLFHQPSDTQKNLDKEKLLKEIRFQNEIEKSARQFFQPLEQEFYRLRLKLEMEERKFLFETNGDLNTELIDELWNLPDIFDAPQKSSLGLLMPLLNKIAGDTGFLSFLMSLISGDRVEVSQSAPGRHKVDDAPLLGNSRLGIDTVLDGELESCIPSYLVRIFPEKTDRLTDYLPGGEKMKMNEFFCTLLLPLENDINFELDLSSASLSFVLENEKDSVGRLNYSTVI